MKKIICILLLILICFQPVNAYENNITIRVNENNIYSDVPPVMKNDRTFLPIRAILNAIGVDNKDIIWWELSNAVEIRHDDTHIFMPVDSYEVIVNNTFYYIDAPAFVKDGRTLVPVRFLSEVLNCKVDWNEETYTVDITN